MKLSVFLRLLFIPLSVCIVVEPLVAEEEVQVGRYSSIQPVPTESQQDVFRTVSSIRFPDSVITVGDAVEHLLDEQGYRVATGEKVDARMQVLLELPLPKSHRSLGPMSLKSMLETLAGPIWFVVQDPIHRLVAFELCEQYPSEDSEE